MVFCVVFCVFVFICALSLVGSQLFLQIGFLNDFESQKKWVGKHCAKVMKPLQLFRQAAHQVATHVI